VSTHDSQHINSNPSSEIDLLGYPLSEYLKKLNTSTIVIPAANNRNAPRGVTNSAISYPHAYSRVKNFLKDMLREILNYRQTHPDDLADPALKDLSPAQMVDGLKNQLGAFWHNEWPFNQPVNNGNPLAWWEALRYHPHARVLAVRHKTLSL
jgi:hypothetical protein